MRVDATFSPNLVLSWSVAVALVSVAGCQQIAELTGQSSQDNEPKRTDASSKKDESAGDENGPETASKAEKTADLAKNGVPSSDAEASEPIPVQPMHTGLDLMLSFVDSPDAKFMMIRDASVVSNYMDQLHRFWDGPLAKLDHTPLADELNITDVKAEYDTLVAGSTSFFDAIQSDKLHLERGFVFVDQSGSPGAYFVISAEEVGPVIAMAKAMGETITPEQCQVVEGHTDWIMCAERAEQLAEIELKGDPQAMRKLLMERWPGVDLDDANILANEIDDDINGLVVATYPGSIQASFAFPQASDAAEFGAMFEPGNATLLDRAEPGAGFVWGRMAPDQLKSTFASTGLPDEEGSLSNALSGEWLVRGALQPGGVVAQLALTEGAAFDRGIKPMLAAGGLLFPKKIDGAKGSKVAVETAKLTVADTQVDAWHVSLTGIPEVEAMKAFTGLHFDGWVLHDDQQAVVALGPDAEHVGSLLEPVKSDDGSARAAWPQTFSAAVEAGRVAFAVHVPTDFAQSPQMRTWVSAALKEAPEVDISALLTASGLVAPVSTVTLWVEVPRPGEVIMRVFVQGIGTTVTEEGRAALEAAHAVVDGADPQSSFAPLVAKYENSPMAFAYGTRAGSEGPGSMVSSGLGTLAAFAAVIYPMVEGHRNESLIDDLGVEADTPEPDLEPDHSPSKPELEDEDAAAKKAEVEEAAKKAEAAAKEAQAKKAAEAKKKAEAKKAAEAKKKAEAKKAAEAKKKAEAKKEAEAKKRVEEARKRAEERRKQNEEARKKSASQKKTKSLPVPKPSIDG